jgi:hypothetical protein
MLVLLAATGARPALASAQVLLGPQAGYDYDLREAFLGAGLRIPFGARIGPSSLVANPGLQSYPFLGSGKSFWVVNLDVIYPVPAGPVEPYVGLGLLLSRASVDLGVFGTRIDSEIGMNLKGGAVFGRADIVRPFAEALFRLADSSTLLLKGGLLLVLPL